MATLQIHIDDNLKKQVDTLFSSSDLDTSTAISIFEAVYDSRFQHNLNGPFENAEDAIASMLED